MPIGNPDKLFPIFFGVWAVLGLLSAGFFFLNRKASLKRKVWPGVVHRVGEATSLLENT